MTYLKTPVEAALVAKFMTTQSVGNLLATRPSNSFSTQFVLGSASVQNRSSNAAVVGVGGRMPVDLWEAGQWVDATTTYTADTTDAQDAGASDFALETLTNNDGHIYLCQLPFNIISVIVGTASAGATPAVYEVSYSLAGGTWSTLSNLLVAPLFTSTGEQLLWFTPPANWAVTEAGHGTGITTDRYGLRVRATTAPAGAGLVAGLASLIVLGRMYYSTEAVADNATYLRTEDEAEFPIAPQLDGLCMAISDLTAVQSRATVTYRMKG